MELLATLGRVVFGLFFAFNGLNHFLRLAGMTEYARAFGVPAPRLAVIVTGLMLLLGGLGFVLDVQRAVAAWLLVVFLVAAAFTMHAFWKLDDPMQQANQMAHFLKNLALAGAALALGLA